ncbi:hypothetical protein NF27_DR00160 [Candidatus Jidaibacter acanthamoeba]|uniref:Uncharacterized protein n=1 Tax=Candidatus Jidaibacter acanthamoebae TaxID=86105 RepID=A0A0C1MZF3_9RICK|nr:hypothetical protein [Candidatus Jidaibacter acanthamoeba]KIE05451.1 hypothetical protein NF27_DR00160 [Candidatus Jidaibacter acanthamoeba]
MKRRSEERFIPSSQTLFEAESNKRPKIGEEGRVEVITREQREKTVIRRKKEAEEDKYADLTADLFRNKKYEETVKIASEYLEKNLRSINVGYNCALAYLYLRRFEDCYEQCKKLLAISPLYKKAILLKIISIQESLNSLEQPIYHHYKILFLFNDIADSTILYYRKTLSATYGLSTLFQEVKEKSQEKYINQSMEVIAQALQSEFGLLKRSEKNLLNELEVIRTKITNINIATLLNSDINDETRFKIEEIYSLSYNIINIINSLKLVEKIKNYTLEFKAPVENLILDILDDKNLMNSTGIISKALIRLFTTNPKWFKSCLELCRTDSSRQVVCSYLENEIIDSIGLELLYSDNRRGLKLFCLLFEDDPILGVTIRSFKQIAFPKGYDDPELEYTTDVENVETKPTRTPVSALASTMKLCSFDKGKEVVSKEACNFSELLSEEASKQYGELPELVDDTPDNAGETNTQENSPDLTGANVQAQHTSYADKVRLAKETKNKENVPPKKFTLTQAPDTSGGFRKLVSSTRLNLSILPGSGESKLCQTSRSI